MILTREEALKYHRQMWSDMKDVLVTIRTLMSVLDLKISGALNSVTDDYYYTAPISEILALPERKEDEV